MHFFIEVQPDIVTIKMNSERVKFSLKKIKIKQFVLNSRISITVHKLQGMTKETMIVARNENRVKIWLYVLMSREKQRKDFFNDKMALDETNKQNDGYLKDELR